MGFRYKGTVAFHVSGKNKSKNKSKNKNLTSETCLHKPLTNHNINSR